MVKVFRRLKLVAFNKENLERTLGINNLRKRLDDIVKVRHFNDEMENKQIKFIYDLTVKNIKKEIDKSKDDSDKVKFLEDIMKELEEKMQKSLNPKD